MNSLNDSVPPTPLAAENPAEAVEQQARMAREAWPALAAASEETRNAALQEASRWMASHAEEILAANARDVARLEADPACDAAFRDRLVLTPERLDSLLSGLRQVAELPGVLGTEIRRFRRPNGLLIRQIRVPLGVVGIIFESRPNVSVDAGALCIKTGNACLLKGGSEATESNRILTRGLQAGLQAVGLPAAAVQNVEGGHGAVQALVRLRGWVDVVIPRGSGRLIEAVATQATVPVIETGAGNCHVYVDAHCDLDMAVNIVVNAKTSRPSVCNAMETLLVHAQAAAAFLPRVAAALLDAGVELRACPRSLAYLQPTGPLAGREAQLARLVKPARESDWAQEFLALILAVKVVDSCDEAIAHINRYGTHHSEAIVTNDPAAAAAFQARVDAACVYHNASTRFTDGGEFGFGAEVGISTQKLHARGPMGLEALTSYKYLIDGSGQIR